jgi:cytochrome c biogenesis protein CcmG/thiol:disulfide interchange protein DsbE
MMKTVINVTIAIILIANAIMAGEKAVNFSLPDSKGNMVVLSDFKGKVVLLNFWATWCPPCREEIPYFNEFQRKYKQQGLQVIGISLDQGGKVEVERFMKANQVLYPVLMGDNKIADVYQKFLPADQRNAIPFTFIIDRQGNIFRKYVGSRPEKVFEADILEALKKK